MTVTTNYTPENASALVALYKAHPRLAPDHLVRTFHNVIGRQRTRRQASKRDWIILRPENRRPYGHPPIPRTEPLHDRIIQASCIVLKLTREDLRSPRRPADLVRARQICMYLLRLHCRRASLPMIGRWLNRDHTTVLHGARAVERDYADYAGDITAIEDLAL